VRGPVRFHTEVIGDPIIVRADGMPAYNLAVVVDDALMGITHVIRGEDHISNTPRQLLLYEALGFSPPVFAHPRWCSGRITVRSRSATGRRRWRNSGSRATCLRHWSITWR
jgi:glutamyl/glutaminyl-tRNA synthetase